jgi:hypothetical protein
MTTYSKTTWANGTTGVSAERLNNAEAGIESAHSELTTHQGSTDHDSHNDARYLGITAKAADADKLDNHDSAYFMVSTARVLGGIESRSVGTVYQASTDGFVLASFPGTVASGTVFTILSDGSNPPTTELMRSSTSSGDNATEGGLCLPVKSGNYYKVVNNAGTSPNAYWIPFS